ncbi:hypothetical protein PCYB_121640 [Plasmodium cynomolgi strain B]|uniref:Uncharacterized protein n=1 Tax=Plasmodium cynomolgi (strain B) TaxID=1120755 RepID=K6UE22_PLACD|nr:hypothetical protein PCYB_121640 [Plasmodium cynomolgi strain B]GAB67596.1 hypothetical protein PCYB_121640 [Plasmodium cynomolgi strain B]
MKTITENAVLTETICPSKNVLKYEEKVFVNRGESLIKVDPSYYIKQKVLNIQNLNYLLSSYSEFFENYRTLCILSVLNIFIVLFLLLLYLLFSLIIFLPAFFLICSLFFCSFPMFYPLIKVPRERTRCAGTGGSASKREEALRSGTKRGEAK